MLENNNGPNGLISYVATSVAQDNLSKNQNANASMYTANGVAA